MTFFKYYFIKDYKIFFKKRSFSYYYYLIRGKIKEKNSTWLEFNTKLELILIQKVNSSFSFSIGHTFLVYPLLILRFKNRLISARREFVIWNSVERFEGLHTCVRRLSNDNSLRSHVRGGNRTRDSSFVTYILKIRKN